jgi:hypothetical protein
LEQKRARDCTFDSDDWASLLLEVIGAVQDAFDANEMDPVALKDLLDTMWSNAADVVPVIGNTYTHMSASYPWGECSLPT